MTTYKIDQSAVRDLTRRNPVAEAESAATHGFYSYYEYKVVPLSAIYPEKVWREAKLQAVQRDIERRRPLAPIRVIKKGSKYHIEDGIHRYNASMMDPSITHIPIVEHVTVDAPDDRVQLVDTKKLAPGTWVKLHDPGRLGMSSPWAVVVEHLSTRNQSGALRHRYSLAGFVDGEPDIMAGDINDDQFEPVPGAPGSVRALMQNEFDAFKMKIRLAHRYMEGGKIQSDWIDRVRKTWKAKTKIPTITDWMDGTTFLQDLIDFVDQMAEDLLFNKGFYALPQEGPASIPRRLKDKVIEELKATREALDEQKRTITTSGRAMDPSSREHRMEGGFTYNFYQKKDPRSPLRAFAKGVRSRVEEAVSEAHKAFSRRMLGAITRYMNKYNEETIDFGHIDLKFSVGNVTAIYQDFPQRPPQGGPLSLLPRPDEGGHRYPQPDEYAKQLKVAQALLRKKGLDFLWYGVMKIRCKSCGGDNPLGSHFGVGAHYMTRGDFIQVYSNPSSGLHRLILHELGHRYYYRFMSQADRAKFDDYFVGTSVKDAIEILDKYQDVMSDDHKTNYLYSVGLQNRPEDVQFLIKTYFKRFVEQDQGVLQGWLRGVPATSEYGQTISSEDFAEVFKDYVLGSGLTRDQLERFKAFLGRTRRTSSLKSVGGAPWQKVRLPGYGLLWTEPVDSEDAFPGAIASYEEVGGWIVYKGRNGSVGIVVGSATELQKWKRDVGNILDVAPQQQGAREWTPQDGGERHVQKAVAAAQKVLRALGAPAKIVVMVDSKGEPHGEASGNQLSLVNVHLGPGKGRKYIGGARVPQHLQVATHEAAHLGYSKGGKKVLQAIREHLKSGGDYLTMYHSMAGDFEGVMEAAAFYALDPKAFQRAAPLVYEATREWFGGSVVRVADRWLTQSVSGS